MSSPVPFDDGRALLAAAALIDPSLIEFPNEPFVEPVGDPPSLWLSFECVGRVLDPVEMTGGVWQEEGTTYIHVIAPPNTGSEAARTLAKSVANVFRNLGPRNVIYRGAAIGNGAEIQLSGIWWILTVTVDWVYQDIT